jgi:hypothetical protein
MSQVKNMPWSPASLLQNALHLLSGVRWVGIECDWVEVALDADIPEPLPGVVEFYAEVHADDITTSLTHEFQ